MSVSWILYQYSKSHITGEHYLGIVIDIVILLILHDSRAADGPSFPSLTLKYAGCLGLAMIIVSLLNIATTSDMVGRSHAFSCVQSNAMLMHLIISCGWFLGTNDASTRSVHLPSSHNCHAYFKFNNTTPVVKQLKNINFTCSIKLCVKSHVSKKIDVISTLLATRISFSAEDL